MSPDHLCEEGLANREDIEIPFHVVFSFSTILIFLYGIHLNAHFYFFGLTGFSCGHIISYWRYTVCCFIGTSFYDLIIVWNKSYKYWTLPRVETARKIN